MQRNVAIFAAVGFAAAALATAAVAQSAGADQVSSYMPPAPVQTEIPLSPSESEANLSDRYDHAIVMLKKKMERLTREDGGQLSAGHQASLQKELDEVNRHFRDAARFAQR